MSSLVNVHWDSKLPIYEISHLKLQNEGIKSLLIDVDGTLSVSYTHLTLPTKA